ncbi:MAG: mannose-6-phosphate isomerase, class I [Chitinophagaceae bacterium]
MTIAGRLTGIVKHYDWGGISFIPSLLAISNKEEQPFAEYWMGVHPQAGCKVEFDQESILLPDIINKYGTEALGDYVSKRFGNIPFLLKVLDVKNMLSIQVHPSKAEAEKDFAKENEAGVPLDAAERNYKDTNHKPELMVAMGEFWLLHGFKSEDILKQTLAEIAELQSLLPVFEKTGYAGLYRKVMEMPQEEVNKQLKPLLDRIIPLYKEGKLDRSTADYWAAKGALTFSQPGRTDRGIFSVYLFNLVHLKRGEAVFQDAGVPHAYLEGQNVEIMASSDNVLRGGLTTKHIDVKELLKHVRSGATIPNILQGTKENGERKYKTPAPDFELGSFEISKGSSASFTATTAEILLLVEGSVEVTGQQEKIILKKGAPSAIVFAGANTEIVAMEKSLVFRATVPAPIP